MAERLNITVPEHVCDCTNVPSPAEKIMAESWEVSHEQAHAINQVVFDSLIEAVMNRNA